jgi:hypothetical protein
MIVSMYDVTDKVSRQLSPTDKAKNSARHWRDIQTLAFKKDKKSFDKITDIVLDERRTSVKLPIVKVAMKDAVVSKTKKGEAPVKHKVSAKQLVICDLVSQPNIISVRLC